MTDLLDSYMIRIRLVPLRSGDIDIEDINDWINNYNGVIVYDDRPDTTDRMIHARMELQRITLYDGREVYGVNMENAYSDDYTYTWIVRYIIEDYNLIIIYRTGLATILTRIQRVLDKLSIDKIKEMDINSIAVELEDIAGYIFCTRRDAYRLAEFLKKEGEGNIDICVDTCRYWRIHSAFLIHSFKLNEGKDIPQGIWDLIQYHKLRIPASVNILVRPM